MTKPNAPRTTATQAPHTPGNRRAFLRKIGEAGLLAGAAVAGGAAVGPATTAATSPPRDARADLDAYHETEHIRKYYATSRIF